MKVLSLAILETRLLLFFWPEMLILQEQSGFNVSWKLCLNLCSRKGLKPKRSLVINLMPIVSLTLLALGRIKFNSDFLNIL